MSAYAISSFILGKLNGTPPTPPGPPGGAPVGCCIISNTTDHNVDSCSDSTKDECKAPDALSTVKWADGSCGQQSVCPAYGPQNQPAGGCFNKSDECSGLSQEMCGADGSICMWQYDTCVGLIDDGGYCGKYEYREGCNNAPRGCIWATQPFNN